MSELKVHRFITTDELFPEANAGALYYDKSEADKVIAELKARIAEMEEELRWRKFPDEKPEEWETQPTSPAAELVLHGGGCMKYLKLPLEIVGFVFVTAVTLRKIMKREKKNG